jgi:hypothetical protein
MHISGMAGNPGGPLPGPYDSQPLTPVRDLMSSGMVDSGQFTSNSNMSLLFWLAIAFGLLEVVVMFEKYDFLNVIILFNVVISIRVHNIYLPVELLR